MVYKRGNIFWVKYYANGRAMPQAERLRFEDLATDFLADYRIDGKRSLDKAHVSVRRLASYFGGWKVSAITTPEIRKYTAKRQGQGAANASINRELAALERMFNLAHRAKIIPTKPYVPLLQEDNAPAGLSQARCGLWLRHRLAEARDPRVGVAAG